MFVSLASCLDASLARAFQSLDLPLSLARAEPSARPELGDFQCNGALAAARAVGRAPRAIADELAMILRVEPLFADVGVAGPGFLNLRLAPDFLGERLGAMAAEPGLGVPDEGAGRLAILDFGGPNVAKPLHVGHLRSLTLGESLRRILTALGWRTLADVHLGDWGLQMGMLVAAIRRRQPHLPYFATSPAEVFPAAAPVTIQELERLYPEAAAACRADPERMAEARADTAALQAGDPGRLALWQALRTLSLTSQIADFHALGVDFDVLGGESDVRDAVPPLVAALRASGVARESDGALVVDVADVTDTYDLPPLLLSKSDGAALYATTDLATLQARMASDPARVDYVVDQRQALHFEQVFRAARKAGIAKHVALRHVGFGTVNGPDGKPFKTRDGGVARLSGLLGMAVAKAAERIDASGYGQDFGAQEKASLARAVGIGAVKFADLSGDRLSGYVFDPDRLVSFEGRTGPYLQYACVRLRSIVAKAAAAGVVSGEAHPVADVERLLAIACLGFGDSVSEAARTMQPGVLAGYAYDLAQRFSRFYAACPVVAETDAAIRASRLGLCLLTGRVLERVLFLLGIEVPPRM